MHSASLFHGISVARGYSRRLLHCLFEPDAGCKHPILMTTFGSDLVEVAIGGEVSAVASQQEGPGLSPQIG